MLSLLFVSNLSHTHMLTLLFKLGKISFVIQIRLKNIFIQISYKYIFIQIKQKVMCYSN